MIATRWYLRPLYPHHRDVIVLVVEERGSARRGIMQRVSSRAEARRLIPDLREQLDYRIRTGHLPPRTYDPIE